MIEEQAKLIEPILSAFENDDIKEFAYMLVDGLPPYIWEVGASSSGKYHPDYTLGKYGLMKHQIAVVRFLNFFFELEQYQDEFDSRERDLLRIAGLVHDGRKSGSQEEFEHNKYTKFDHPIAMARVIASYRDKGLLPDEELKIIASAISKHMGQWNVDKKSKDTLPKPNDKYSKLLHLADYLASRKCLNMSFDDYKPSKTPNVNEYILPFGKYRGLKLIDVASTDKGYIEWCKANISDEPLCSLLKQL